MKTLFDYVYPNVSLQKRNLNIWDIFGMTFPSLPLPVTCDLPQPFCPSLKGRGEQEDSSGRTVLVLVCSLQVTVLATRDSAD